jgi:hypothetical protein
MKNGFIKPTFFILKLYYYFKFFYYKLINKIKCILFIKNECY